MRGLEIESPRVPVEQMAEHEMPMSLLDSGSISPTQSHKGLP